MVTNLLPTLEILASSVVVGYIATLVDRFFGFTSFYSPFALVVGGACLFFGLFVRVWASAAFTRHQVRVLQLRAPEALVTDGPYAYSRHPLYVGIIALVVGVAILYGSWSMLAFSLVLWCFGDWWIRRHEEPGLMQKFGSTYDDYVHRVRRWF